MKMVISVSSQLKNEPLLLWCRLLGCLLVRLSVGIVSPNSVFLLGRFLFSLRLWDFRAVDTANSNRLEYYRSDREVIEKLLPLPCVCLTKCAVWQ